MNQPRFIKMLVLGLPIGLFLIGGGSLLWHFKYPKPTGKAPENPPSSRPITQLDLQFYVTRMARDIGPRPATSPNPTKASISFIQGTLGMNNIGFMRVETEPFSETDPTLVNLFVEVPGSDASAGTILVAAHYDSPPDSPGANANGTGVAANLALANYFLGRKPKHTLRFAFLGNALGAPPNGPQTLAKAYQTRGRPLSAVICLDQLGYFTDATNSQQPWPGDEAPLPTIGNFLVFAATPASKALLTDCLQRFSKNSSLPVQQVSAPDIQSPLAQAFATLDIPTLLLTDTAKLRHPNTGTAQDLPEPLDIVKFTEAVRGISAMLESLAQ